MVAGRCAGCGAKHPPIKHRAWAAGAGTRRGHGLACRRCHRTHEIITAAERSRAEWEAEHGPCLTDVKRLQGHLRSRARAAAATAAMLLALVIAAPAEARTEGYDDVEIGNAVVSSFVNPFTDAYRATVLMLIEPEREDQGLMLSCWADGDVGILAYDNGRGRVDLAQEGEPVMLALRIGRGDAVWWDAEQLPNTDKAAAALTISSDTMEEVLRQLAAADQVVFSIGGSPADAISIPVPERMPELIAEFRRRVEAERQHTP